ncbi:MAG: hypothetical protein ACI9R3_001402 [Verrucomicrobiales bacterium]|jgi:hypothetical protein
MYFIEYMITINIVNGFLGVENYLDLLEIGFTALNAMSGIYK